MQNTTSKKEKSQYRKYRDDANMTREQAAEIMCTTKDRLAKIETGTTVPTPIDIIAMAKCYKNNTICNYYCSNVCEIGKDQVQEITLNNLPMITVNLLTALNKLNREKERLTEISADAKLTSDEYDDFIKILSNLDDMSNAIDALKVWVKDAIANGEIDCSLLNKR